MFSQVCAASRKVMHHISEFQGSDLKMEPPRLTDVPSLQLKWVSAGRDPAAPRSV